MEVDAAIRRIKRQFGDEYDVTIINQDIYDWMYDAELDIIRSTSENDTNLVVPANNFPLQLPDKVNVKRVSVNNKALTYISRNELDLSGRYLTTEGTPHSWYYENSVVYLWPVPESTDKYNVEVIYYKTPNVMSIVAPYLSFVTNPAALQVANVPSDNDWKLSTSVNLAIEMSVDSVSRDFLILNCGGDQNANNNHFFLGFQIAPINSLYFSVSDRTDLSAHTLRFAVGTTYAAGEIIKFRVAFDSRTDTAYLWRIDRTTGQEVLQDTSTHSRVFNKNTQSSADLHIGNRDDTTVPTVPPAMKIYSLELREEFKVNPHNSPVVFYFDGKEDLGTLFAPTATVTTSSNHPMTTLGGIVVNAYNSFTVPEVYHEDLVKYCLSRAHSKNQNFRAAEAEMEQYDRRVSTRRNEAQSADTNLYKIPDPLDFDMESY